jgi:aromatic amino acid aminotransferase I
MLPVIRVARLRPLIRHTRMIQSSSRHLSSTEAAPAARPAHYDTSQQLSAIDAVKERRLKAGRLVAGVAAASDSDMFKGPVSPDE